MIEHDVDVIAPPEIDITGGQESGDVAFDAVVEVRPTIEVPGYGGLSVTLERPGVDEEALDAQIDRMRDLDSTLEVVDRPAQDGDTVTIDIAGTLDGEAQPGLTADDYSYTVGSGAITPEVDEHLVGAAAGTTLSFSATHPDPDEERELQFELRRQRGEGEGAPRDHRRVGIGGVGVRDRRRAASEPGRSDDRGCARPRPRWRCARRWARRWPRSSPTSSPSR